MAKYRRVTYEDRCQIFLYRSMGISISTIAKELELHKSTISRELKRNAESNNYKPWEAEALARRRKSFCRRKAVITPEISVKILVLLEFGLSPEQIAGRLRHEKVLEVSSETLYQHIHKQGRRYKKHLRRFGKRGGGRMLQSRGNVSRQRSIRERPEVVDARVRRGDWERDGMYISDRNQLLVFNERKSRFVKIVKMGKGRPKEVTNLTNQTLNQFPIRSYTMTNDNGPEFRDSKNVTIKTYHCDIGKPQQRGTIENTIGLLRQYIDRKVKQEDLTEDEIKRIENFINFRPRKCLDYRTPFEVLFKTSVALAT